MIFSNANIKEGYMFVSKENENIELIYTALDLQSLNFSLKKIKLPCSQTFILFLL